MMTTVEASFKVTNCVRVFDWPCCNKVRPFVDRENAISSKVSGLDQIFDRIDSIFSRTSLTWTVWLLLPLIGLVGTLALVFTDNINYTWMPWVFPQSLVQPLHGWYWWQRRKGLKKALMEWNRDVGASQGCSLQFGVDGQVTNYRMFEGASTYGQCSCCRHEAVLLLCRGTQDNIV